MANNQLNLQLWTYCKKPEKRKIGMFLVAQSTLKEEVFKKEVNTLAIILKLIEILCLYEGHHKCHFIQNKPQI